MYQSSRQDRRRSSSKDRALSSRGPGEKGRRKQRELLQTGHYDAKRLSSKKVLEGIAESHLRSKHPVNEKPTKDTDIMTKIQTKKTSKDRGRDRDNENNNDKRQQQRREYRNKTTG